MIGEIDCNYPLKALDACSWQLEADFHNVALKKEINKNNIKKLFVHGFYSVAEFSKPMSKSRQKGFFFFNSKLVARTAHVPAFLFPSRKMKSCFPGGVTGIIRTVDISRKFHDL